MISVIAFSPSITSMSSTFDTLYMYSLLLFSLSVCQVSSQSPIANIGLLGNYLGGATRFWGNRQLFNGLSLVAPKPPLQHSPAHHHHFHPHRHRHRPFGFPRPLMAHNHPLYPHLDPLPQHNPLPPPLEMAPPQILLSPVERPALTVPEGPIFHSLIVPKNENLKKPKKNSKKKSKSRHRKRKNRKGKSKKSYPKSINDRLREKDNETVEDDDPHWNNDIAEYDDHYENPPPSFYDSMPPFSKPKTPPVDLLKEKQKQELSKKKINPKKKPSQQISNQLSNSPVPPVQKNTRRPKSEFMSQSWGIDTKDSHNEPIPRYSERIRKPVIQSDSINGQNDDPKNIETSKKSNSYRTATANQLSHKEGDNPNKQLSDEPEHDPPKTELEGITGEDLKSNDDPKAYPHQYAIEIRWKGKDRDHLDLDEPEGDAGDREMHSSKDLDHARHRKYKHEEEEHWHEKDWINEGLKKAYLNGKPVPVHIVKPVVKLGSEPDYGPMPLYAHPMPNGATLDQINQHFAIPTPNFRVNNRFMQWAKSAVDLNGLQNNYVTLYG